ncbi:MAG TPA: DUF484 family protein [Steroidobacteraceae bacterium]|jgi:uncharacterized protein YigA (DUF484 family)|nr:DUF484 family protein [Steroidobacteraceae bacterium]
MTTREARGVSAVETEEETIAAYLQHNPDFFERHHAVLARLRLPHARGGSTISLVERQIEVLREKHAAVEAKLAEFVRVARANDALADKLHRFTRQLLRAGSAEAVVATMESSLRVDFDAFHSVLVLIGPHPEVTAQRFVRVVRADDPNLKSFETLFANGKPRCGQARDSQREFLFGTDANDIGSVALVPLGEKGSIGLLALGSTDRDRFHPGMSTEFLARMADLIADALVPTAGPVQAKSTG